MERVERFRVETGSKKKYKNWNKCYSKIYVLWDSFNFHKLYFRGEVEVKLQGVDRE